MLAEHDNHFFPPKKLQNDQFKEEGFGFGPGSLGPSAPLGTESLGSASCHCPGLAALCCKVF